MNSPFPTDRTRKHSRNLRKRKAMLRGLESLESRHMMAGEVLEIKLDAVALDGTSALPVNGLVEGQEFLLRGQAKDLRTTGAQGAFQVYTDVTYASAEVAPVIHEVQALAFTGTPTGGTFTLTYKGNTTTPINYEVFQGNIQAASIQAALRAIPALGNNVTVEVDTSDSSAGLDRYFIRFENALDDTDVPLLSADTTLLQSDPQDPGAITITEFAKGARSNTEAFKQAFAYNPNSNTINPALSKFPDQRQGADNTDLFDNVGGGSLLFAPPGAGYKTYFLLRARAITGGVDGKIEFTNAFPNAPGLDPLLFGLDNTLTPSDVLFTYGGDDPTGGHLQIKVSPSGIGVVNDSGYTVDEDSPATPLTPSPLANDSQTGAGALTITNVTTGSAGGTLTIINNGANVSYKPKANYFGPETFTYTVSNGQGASADGTISIDVTPINDAPSFTKGPDVSVIEDFGLKTIANWATNISAGPNESGQTLTFIVSSTNPTLFQTAPTITAAGTLSFKPAANQNGVATVTVSLRDNGGISNGGVNFSASQTFTITVTSVNDAPVQGVPGPQTSDGTAAVVFQGATKISITDVDAGSSPVVTTLSVLHGRLQLGGTVSAALAVSGDDTSVIKLTGTVANINAAISTLRYLPNSGFKGSDTLQIVTNDQGNTGAGGPLSDTDTVAINITSQAAPFAADDSRTLNEDSGPFTIDVLANDIVHANSTPILKAFTQPATGGTVKRDDNGTPNNLGDDKLIFTPVANFNGAVQFTYSINDTDGTGADSIGTVRLTVQAVNDAPVNVVPGAQTVQGGQPLVFQGAKVIKVSDVDTTTKDLVTKLTVNNGVLTLGGTIAPALVVTGNNSASITLTGTWPQINAAISKLTYTPNGNFGGTDTLTVFTNDQGNVGIGGPLTDTDTVLISVQGNSIPGAVNDTVTIAEDSGAKSINVLANDTVHAGSSAVLKSVSSIPAASGTLTIDTNGTATQTDDKVLFTPALNFNGQVQFTYVMNDTDGTGSDSTGVVTVNVTPVNDAPNATPNFYVFPEDTTLTVSASNGVLANDSDVDNAKSTLTAVKVTDPAHGTLVFNSDGSFTYKPDADYSGQDVFRYQAKDPSGALSVSRAVTLYIQATNDPPVASNKSYQAVEDVQLFVSATNGLLVGATDPDGTNSFRASRATDANNGTVSVNPDGSFSYKPNANFFGTDSFTYRVSDTVGGLSAPKMVTIAVAARNDAPTASSDSYTTSKETALVVPVNLGLLKNDTDPDGDPLHAVRASQGASGKVTQFAGDGSFTYVPNAGFIGTDSFQYWAVDNANAANSYSAKTTVTIVVTPQNQAPTGASQSYSMNEDGTLVVPAASGLLVGSSDPEGNPLSAVIISQPSKGMLVATGSDGSFTYKPNANVFGTDTFTYRVSDGQLYSALQTATITVAAVNDPPPAVNDFYNVFKNVANQALPDVLANDRSAANPDGNESLSISTFNAATTKGGTVTKNASDRFFYTPKTGFVGTDTFNYTVSDGNGGTKVATVTLDVRQPASTLVTGFVYRDTNNNGVHDADEYGVGNVVVRLAPAGNASAGQDVKTDGTGRYIFNAIPSGNYVLTEVQPEYLADGAESIGSAGGQKTNDRFTFTIPVSGLPNNAATNYNFGEGGILVGSNPNGDPELNYTLEEILASSNDTTMQGAIIAVDGTQQSWFTTLDPSWANVRTMAVQVSPDMNSIVLTLLVNQNGVNQAYQGTIYRSSTADMSLSFRVMATNGEGFQLIRVDGPLDLTQFTPVDSMFAASSDAVMAAF